MRPSSSSSWNCCVPGSGVRMLSITVSILFFFANVTVSRTELGVSWSAPRTNMPWARMPYSCSTLMACSMSSTVCDFSKLSSVAWLTDSRPRATNSQLEARMSSSSSWSRTTSVRTWAPHGTATPSSIIIWSRRLRRLRLAAMLSS